MKTALVKTALVVTAFVKKAPFKKVLVNAALIVAAIIVLPRLAHAGPAADYSFNGTVSLQGCSGALFRFEGQSMDSKALVLTNGHCIGSLKAYEVIAGQATQRELTFFNAAEAKTSTYVATRIVYATMHQTDMAVLELDVTYQVLKDDADVDALMLATTRANVGDDLVIVSGFWEYTTACKLDGFVLAMKEGRWSWTDSLRFTEECVTFGGTSGSPVISVASGQIIAVNNTGYEGGEACSVNNPCEIDAAGAVTTVADGSYGQQTYQLYSCIDANFAIDPTRTGCELPMPRGVLQVLGTQLHADNECDGDGNVDAGETGILAITLKNDGPVALTNTGLTLTTTSSALQFVDAATLQVDSLPAFGTITINIAVALADDVSGVDNIAVVVALSNPESAATDVSASSLLRVNYDDVANSSATDDVESNITSWTTDTELTQDATARWTRERDVAPNTVWRARDLDGPGDQRLESARLQVGAAPFVVRFSHRFRFEASGPSEQQPTNTYWDGAVIEVSTDGGINWSDASQFATLNYGGTITDQSGNPLANRDGFVGTSPNWPDTTDAVLDFGTQLANKAVTLRFRVGSDAAAGDFGWQIDDIEVEGITNLPFSSIGPDPDSCATPDVDQPDPPSTSSGGGCSTGGSNGSAWLIGLLLVALASRRRR